MMKKIRLSTGREVPARAGQSILDALKEAEVFLTASCGGKGTCGKCKVKLLEGKAGIEGYGKLTTEERKAGLVLACQSFPEGGISIEIPENSRIVVGEKIAVSRAQNLLELVQAFGSGVSPLVEEAGLDIPHPAIEDNSSDLERLKRALREARVLDDGHFNFSHAFLSGMGHALREAGWEVVFRYAGRDAVSVKPKGRTQYGVAVDIGTTTVVVYLVDLSSGRLIDAGSTYNSQIRYGDDVITRIIQATEGGQLSTLRETVRDDINGLIGAMLQKRGIPFGDVEFAVISGNTTMSHLFWGFNPASIREEPYVPGVSFYPLLRGADSGLAMDQGGIVYTLPSVASYVGGDIVAGVLASGMNRKSEVALFMDIGTNGEIAVGNNEWLMTAACSAGPCFEGSGIRHGMRATEGAIESVKIRPGDFEPEIGIISGNHGEKTPVARGVCGSGMIDAISEMLLKGVIDRKGKFHPGLGTPRLRRGEDGMEFVLAKNSASGDITLTEVDIENILRAKAAIYAGVSSLLKEVGLTLDAIEKVYIAGGFGNYLNVEKAIILGMLPDMPREKFVFLGNTSITGAYLCLVSGDLREEAGEIASKMTYMELSVSPGFMNEYMSALFLPHTDASQFPTVEKMLGADQPL
ncbi:MAG: ASKHA domain-containing protein [Nitrospiraceae bacterium]|nr:ASKHA domain-containing protein [Nitrospiraceae bacterium]